MNRVTLRLVADDQWPVVAWLWQDFRHDLGTVVNGFPYADGRYQHSLLDRYPGQGRVGYLAWQPHPVNGADAPVAFALVSGLDAPRRALDAFFVVPAARQYGLGMLFATEVIAKHPGAWEIGFQHENAIAGVFWRRVAEAAWGDDWIDTIEAVPGKPDVPADHWIRTI
ncbi:GNAT family N-acetyltransferase [Mycobacteroides abscessus]|uniref:GNAT family N-acetyltransferase n=1 Tax=Mycobacteroides abscessus TaxID=36809 RepID=UPI0010441FFD|nr:GNAT family N-acetyltransferase [Mycobacteroides abscessus]